MTTEFNIFGAAYIEHIMSLRDIPDDITRSRRLLFESAALFGHFDPQSVEKLLRETGSTDYLIALPIEKISEMTSRALIAVLPQTNWNKYPYGIAILTTETLDEEFRAGPGYRQNFNNLKNCGIPMLPPEDESQTVMDAITKVLDL